MSRLRNEKGQSTVEFALAMGLMMGFILFFIQVCLIFSYGNLVHYATFMAARAYLAAGPEDDDQKERAKDVIIRLLKKSKGQPGLEKYPFIARGDGGDGDVPGLTIGPGSRFDPKDASLSWMQGVRYRFRGKVSLVPIGNGRGSANFVTLTSESWLGKETSFESCRGRMGQLGGGAIFDNGC